MYLIFLCTLLNTCGLHGEVLRGKNKEKRDDLTEKKSNVKLQDEVSMNLSNVVVSDVPLYLDACAYVTPNALATLKKNDLTLYGYFGEIMPEVARIYGTHGIEFSLRSLVSWTDEIPASINSNIELDGYELYFKSLNLDCDMYFVFDTLLDENLTGYANTRSICLSSAVAIIDIGTINLFRVSKMAKTIAHEAGHVLGFHHSDRRGECQCAIPNKIYCVMNGNNNEWKGPMPQTIENCLLTKHLKRLQRTPCLLRKMTLPRLFPSCGDTVRDVGEDCDCGYSMRCNLLTSMGNCCNRHSCKLLSKNFQCDHGKCCTNCRFSRGTLCRNAHSDCDLDDYCNGKSSMCYTDRVKPNFTICNGKRGFCFQGNCVNINNFCELAFNNRNFYFSKRCVKKALSLIKTCPTKATYEPVEAVLCNKKPNLCDHLICAVQPGSFGVDPNFLEFKASKNRCVLPSLAARHGLLVKPPTFMPCNVTGGRNSTVSGYCYQGNCTLTNFFTKHNITLPSDNPRGFSLKIMKFISVENYELVYVSTDDDLPFINRTDDDKTILTIFENEGLRLGLSLTVSLLVIIFILVGLYLTRIKIWSSFKMRLIVSQASGTFDRTQNIKILTY